MRLIPLFEYDWLKLLHVKKYLPGFATSIKAQKTLVLQNAPALSADRRWESTFEWCHDLGVVAPLLFVPGWVYCWQLTQPGTYISRTLMNNGSKNYFCAGCTVHEELINF